MILALAAAVAAAAAGAAGDAEFPLPDALKARLSARHAAGDAALPPRVRYAGRTHETRNDFRLSGDRRLRHTHADPSGTTLEVDAQMAFDVVAVDEHDGLVDIACSDGDDVFYFLYADTAAGRAEAAQLARGKLVVSSAEWAGCTSSLEVPVEGGILPTYRLLSDDVEFVETIPRGRGQPAALVFAAHTTEQSLRDIFPQMRMKYMYWPAPAPSADAQALADQHPMERARDARLAGKRDLDLSFDIFNFNYDRPVKRASEALYAQLGPFGLECGNCYSYLTVGVEVDLQWSSWSLKSSRTVFWGRHETHVEYEIFLGFAGSETWEIPIPLPFGGILGAIWIPVGPVPLTLDVALGLSLGMGLEGTWSFSPRVHGGFHYDTEAQVGFAYSDADGWEEVRYVQPPFISYEAPHLEGDTSEFFSFEMEVDLEASVYLSPSVSVNLRFILKLASVKFSLVPYIGVAIQSPAALCDNDPISVQFAPFYGLSGRLGATAFMDLVSLGEARFDIITSRPIGAGICRDGLAFGDRSGWSAQEPEGLQTYVFTVKRATGFECSLETCDPSIEMRYCAPNGGRCGPYQSVPTIDDTDEPVWTEDNEIVFSAVDSAGSIHIRAIDDDSWWFVSATDVISEGTIELSEISAEGAVDLEIPIYEGGTENGRPDYVYVDVVLADYDATRDYFFRDLAGSDFDDCDDLSDCDTRMEIWYDDADKTTTPFIDGENNPSWAETTYVIRDVPAAASVNFQIVDDDDLSNDDPSRVFVMPPTYCNDQDLAYDGGCPFSFTAFTGTASGVMDRVLPLDLGVYSFATLAPSGVFRAYAIEIPDEIVSWASLVVFAVPAGSSDDPDLVLGTSFGTVSADNVNFFDKGATLGDSLLAAGEIDSVTIAAADIGQSTVYAAINGVGDSYFWLFATPTYYYEHGSTLGSELPLPKMIEQAYFGFLVDLDPAFADPAAAESLDADGLLDGVFMQTFTEDGVINTNLGLYIYSDYGETNSASGLMFAPLNTTFFQVWVLAEIATNPSFLTISAYADSREFGMAQTFKTGGLQGFFFVAVPRDAVSIEVSYNSTDAVSAVYTGYPSDASRLPPPSQMAPLASGAAIDMAEVRADLGLQEDGFEPDMQTKVAVVFEGERGDVGAVDVQVIATRAFKAGTTIHALGREGSQHRFLLDMSDVQESHASGTVEITISAVTFQAVRRSARRNDGSLFTVAGRGQVSSFSVEVSQGTEFMIDLVVDELAGLADGQIGHFAISSTVRASTGVTVNNAKVPSLGVFEHTFARPAGSIGVFVRAIAEAGDPDLVGSVGSSLSSSAQAVGGAGWIADETGDDVLAVPLGDDDEEAFVTVHSNKDSEYTIEYEALLETAVDLAVVDGDAAVVRVTLDNDADQFSFHPGFGDDSFFFRENLTAALRSDLGLDEYEIAVELEDDQTLRVEILGVEVGSFDFSFADGSVSASVVIPHMSVEVNGAGVGFVGAVGGDDDDDSTPGGDDDDDDDDDEVISAAVQTVPLTAFAAALLAAVL